MSQVPTSGDARATPWTQLWRSGTPHSCATAMPGNYEGATLAFWQAQLQRPPAGGVVVDIGTGNGALALLATETARRRGVGFEVHGVDLADIDPARDVPGEAGRFAGIRFHPRTSFTSLPFADRSVDLLCSQFAFEYAPRQPAVEEALRVLGTRGGAAMVLHSDDSVVARMSNDRLPWFQHLLDDSQVLQHAEEMIAILAGARTPQARADLAGDARAEASRKALNASAAGFVDRAREPGAADVLGRFMPALSHALSMAAQEPDRARQALDALHHWLRNERERLLQLRDAQLDDTAISSLAARFSDAGHTVAVGSLEHRPGVKLGWTLEVSTRG